MLTKHTSWYNSFLEIIYLKTKIKTKEHNNRQNLNICIRNPDTNKERKQINISERKVYRRIIGSVFVSAKENWRILTNNEIYAMVKKTHYNKGNEVK